MLDEIDDIRDFFLIALPPALIGYVIAKNKGAYVGGAFGMAASYLELRRRKNARLLAKGLTTTVTSVGDTGLFL